MNLQRSTQASEPAAPFGERLIERTLHRFVYLVAALLALLWLVWPPTPARAVPAPEPVPEPTIEEKILAAFPDAPIMLQVAYCESGHQTPTGCIGPINPSAKNPRSTATGVFQILIGTWAAYGCEGDRMDADDNIACARKIYDQSGLTPWEASRHKWAS